MGGGHQFKVGKVPRMRNNVRGRVKNSKVSSFGRMHAWVGSLV